MLKILPRRSSSAAAETASTDTAPPADRAAAWSSDGKAGGMPAPRRQPEPAADMAPSLVSARQRPA